MGMIRSTLGFIYTPDLKQVLLIEKQKPFHHKGKLNGLGGKCEQNETYRSCLSREVYEESGLQIAQKDWLKIGVMSWQEWHVEIFAVTHKPTQKKVNNPDVDWYSSKTVPTNVISNLDWLIPLGLDCLTNSEPPVVRIKYRD